MNYLFVVGCPRSGTTWISWLLAQHPSTVVSLHTGFFVELATALERMGRAATFGNRILVGQDRTEGTPRGAFLLQQARAVSELINQDELYEASRPLAEMFFQAAARADPDATWVVEVTPEDLFHTELIRKALPGARFLHIIRDPRAIFSSMRASKEWAYPGNLASNPVTFVRDYWSLYDTAAKVLEDQPAIYRSIRYEDLLADGPWHLSGVFRWLGLPHGQELCERAVEASSIDQMRSQLAAPRGFLGTGRADSWQGELSAGHIRTIEYLAGERMEHLGYHCVSASPRSKPLRLWLAETAARAGHSLLKGTLRGPVRAILRRVHRSGETMRRLLRNN